MSEEQKVISAKIAELAAPLQRFMRENLNPHAMITLDSDGVTLYSADSFMPADKGLDVQNAPEEIKEAFVFTFGQNHLDIAGRSIGHCYVVLAAKDEDAARDMMCKARGRKWAFSYPYNMFGDQAEKYDLERVPLSRVTLSLGEVEASLEG